MPPPTATWRFDRDGDWAAGVNWRPFGVPGAADDAAIDTADFHTITHATGAHTVHTLAVGNDDFVVSGGSLTISSTSSFAHALTVSGGTLSLGNTATAASFTQSASTLSGAGVFTVTGAATFSGDLAQTGPAITLLQGASTFGGGVFGVDDGRTLENQGVFTLTGSASIAINFNPLTGVGLGSGALRNDAGATLDMQGSNRIGGADRFINAGTLEKTVGTGTAIMDFATLTNTGAILAQSGMLEIDGVFDNSGLGTASVSSGATLDLHGGGSSGAAAFTVASGATLGFSGGTFVLGEGKVGGKGTVALTAGDLVVDAPTRVSGFAQSGATVSGTGTFTAAGPAAFAGSVLHTGSGVTVLAGASTFDGDGRYGVDGGRTLEIQGGFTLTGSTGIALGFDPFGANLGGGSVVIDAGGTIDLQGDNTITAVFGATSVTNAGTLEKSVGAGKATIDVDAVTNTGAVLVRSGTLVIDCPFSSGASGTITVSSGAKLTLTEAATLSGAIDGAGVVKLSKADLSGLTIGGQATLSDVGILDQTGDIAIGDAGAKAAALSITAGATYDIDNGADIARGDAHGSRIKNSGFLTNPFATAISKIRVKVTNSGAIVAAGGALDFTRAIKGDGTLAVNGGATLEVDASAAASLDMTFNGANATLALGDPARFAATIHAFNEGDTIDLLGIEATAATLGAGNTLVITNGATTLATLQLAGKHKNDAFFVHSDGEGGTNITVSTPGPAGEASGGGASPLRHAAGSLVGHRFIAAMAGFGDGRGPPPTWIETRPDTWRPALSAPRPIHFA